MLVRVSAVADELAEQYAHERMPVWFAVVTVDVIEVIYAELLPATRSSKYWLAVHVCVVIRTIVPAAVPAAQVPDAVVTCITTP